MQFDPLDREVINGNTTVIPTYKQPAVMDFDEPQTLPTFIEPVAPAAGDFDTAPCDLIANLQREAMPILKRLNSAVQEAENRLDSLETNKPLEVMRLCRRLVDTGVFHTDSNGLQLVYTITCNGAYHMQALMQDGSLNPPDYRTVDMQKTGTHTNRIFMLHNSVKQLADLYIHPEVIAMVTPALERQQSEAERLLAEKRIELADYKTSTRKRLQQLEKRFKGMLD